MLAWKTKCDLGPGDEANNNDEDDDDLNLNLDINGAPPLVPRGETSMEPLTLPPVLVASRSWLELLLCFGLLPPAAASSFLAGERRLACAREGRSSTKYSTVWYHIYWLRIRNDVRTLTTLWASIVLVHRKQPRNSVNSRNAHCLLHK